MKDLHPTQKRILELLKNRERCWTIRDLQSELGLSSTSVVFHHIQQLEKKSLLKKDPNNASNYQVIENNGIVYLNLYGMAQCGPDGSILSGEIIERIPISDKILNFPVTEAFLVKARGDSMEPKIYDGDIVIVQRKNFFENGDVVVCSNKGIVMIKKIIFKNNEIYLYSYNSSYQPVKIDKTSFYVDGVVRGVINYSVKDF
ncbi:MAG TPA: S24 family peptidase [Spirochaetota bacterium]|nr:S24 family peptidase [Spirochaetota bacterium]HOL57489.1 S24 family peptidase [Spirochaetota bacterium]HPP04420.1 S24 family peptidase [Spirochaetota bacterium]